MKILKKLTYIILIAMIVAPLFWVSEWTLSGIWMMIFWYGLAISGLALLLFHPNSKP